MSIKANVRNYVVRLIVLGALLAAMAAGPTIQSTHAGECPTVPTLCP